MVIHMTFTLSSPAFRHDSTVPVTFTCDGDDVPPPLSWSGTPNDTRSFALILDDPDAPGGTFTHWLLHDIPPHTTELPATPVGKTLRNSFGRSGYGGPCPPRGHGAHRYFFTLYALDVPTLSFRGKSREDMEKAMQGHVLATARLMGRYERAR
jgi:Raf kinase inhibitor-like YbhB/YbcL family protein